jgi:hypothetical protein
MYLHCLAETDTTSTTHATHTTARRIKSIFAVGKAEIFYERQHER